MRDHSNGFRTAVEPARPLAATIEPLPVLLLRRGQVATRSLGALLSDPRLELMTTNELTTEWMALGQRVAATIVATEGDPLGALGYAVTGGITGPLVMLVNRRHRLDHAELIAAGATGCLTLPLTPTDVDRVVPMLRAHATSSRVDCTLRLILDPIGRTVRYHEKSIRLSQREFAVLHCLSSQRGRPVAAWKLLTYVWGDAPAAARSRQIVDVYIFQLRRKLERLGLSDPIATVRGYGYALVDVARELAAHS